MAYPGVFMLDDGSIFKALRRTSENGGLICMHAENGSAIDVIVQQALAEGKKAPKYHALTRPTTAEAEATARAIALAEMAGAPIYIVHLSCNDALEKSAKPVIADSRFSRKLVLNISIFRLRISMRRVLKVRNMSSHRRCARNGTRKNYGMV